MDKDEKTRETAVYGQQPRCLYKHCNAIIQNPAKGQKFCCGKCKNDHHRMVYDAGLSKIESKGMNYQSLNSPVLQKMLKFLRSGKTHTSIEVMMDTADCGWRATISALRKHGFNIKCEYLGTRNGRKIYQYELIEEES